MKELLKYLVITGKLDAFKGDENQLPWLLSGIDLIRKGALLAGIGQLKKINRWGLDEIELIRNTVPFWRGLNAAAEDYHATFGKPFSDGTLAFLWGALLGPYAGLVFTFYQEAPKFCTRVVGVGHDGREACLSSIERGDAVTLLWEPQNPKDPLAVRVFDSQGRDLGYIRSTVAHCLAARIQAGQVFRGRVVQVLGPEFDINERLNVEIESLGDSGFHNESGDTCKQSTGFSWDTPRGRTNVPHTR